VTGKRPGSPAKLSGWPANLLILAAALLLAEGAARLVYFRVLPRYAQGLGGGRAVTELMADGRTTVPQRYLSHPYMLYVNAPGQADAQGRHRTNSMGYRNPEFLPAKSPGVFRVLVLGGSTAFMESIEDTADTWAAKLESKLNTASKGTRFEVINAGLPGAVSPEILSGYVLRHRYLQPDLVILDGGNDLLALAYENYHPEYTHLRAASNLTLPRPFERTMLRSYLCRLVYILWLRDMKFVYVNEPYPAERLDRPAALERVRTVRPAGFERNMDFLIRSIVNDGAQPVLFRFLIARTPYLTRNRPDLAGTEPIFEAGLPVHNGILRALAGKYGIRFVEPDQARFSDDQFRDCCHLTPDGEDVKAGILFDELAKDPRVAPLVSG